MSIVTSFANPQVKALTALHLRKSRRDTGLFLVEGARHVADGLAKGWKIHTVAFNPKEVTARYEAERFLEVTPDILAKISKKDNPPSVVAAFYQREFRSSDMTQDGAWVALEGIRDPGNLGTILRTVHAAGAKGVVLVGECCDVYSPEVMRASMGSLFSVPVIKMNLQEFTALIPNWEGSVVGTALENRAVDFRKAEYKAPTLIVMGTEQSGLSPVMLDALPHLVKLPMQGDTDSLNLSVATGVMLYAVLYP